MALRIDLFVQRIQAQLAGLGAGQQWPLSIGEGEGLEDERGQHNDDWFHGALDPNGLKLKMLEDGGARTWPRRR